MKLKEIIRARRSNIGVLGSAGVIGLHMVSGPLVGFGIGYALDYWLDTGPWFMLIFFIIGIGAGFKNVYDDTRKLLRQMQAEDDKRNNT